jgi:hypothetical protein
MGEMGEMGEMERVLKVVGAGFTINGKVFTLI